MKKVLFNIYIYKQCYHIAVWSIKNIERTKNGRITFLRKFVVCDSKKWKFIKEQEASGLLTSLGIKTPLDKIYLFIPLLF